MKIPSDMDTSEGKGRRSKRQGSSMILTTPSCGAQYSTLILTMLFSYITDDTQSKVQNLAWIISNTQWIYAVLYTIIKIA